MTEEGQKDQMGGAAKAALLSLLGVVALGVLYWRTNPAETQPEAAPAGATGETAAATGPAQSTPPVPTLGAQRSPVVEVETELGKLRWNVEGTRARMAGEVFGTTFHLTAIETDPARLEALGKTAASALNAVDQEMSTYKPKSGISMFNGPEGSGTLVSKGFVDVLELARSVHDKSGGAFDPTVGALVRAWGFGPDDAPPEAPKELESMRERVDFSKIEWKADEHGRLHVHKRDAAVQLDLSAIAKGYGADRVCSGFAETKLENYMVEVGGEICVGGRPAPDRNWRVGVERPSLARTGLQRALELGPDMQPVGMATSGDYRNYREIDGVRVSHTIDPRTGRPVTHGLASVTVLAPSSAEADAWATALMVLGPEEGFETATKEGIAAYFIVREGESYAERDTPAFATLVEPTWAPNATKPAPEEKPTP